MSEIDVKNFSSILTNKTNSNRPSFFYSQNETKIDTSKLEHSPNQDTFEKNDNKKKILIAGGILATIITVGAIAFNTIRGKNSKITKLKDIKFDKGIASLSDGSKFSGKIEDKLKNGDNIVLEYIDGVLQKSSRSGSLNFEKTYETINSEKIVKTIQNGKTNEINITKIQNEANTSKEKIEKLLKNSSSITLDDFEKQVGDIKYKNKTQEEQLSSIIKQKKEYERLNKDIKDITFKNGKPYLKNGSSFCGTIHATLPNGDKVEIEYDISGRLKKSTKYTKNGEVVFTKEYSQGPTGQRVKITKNNSQVEELDLYEIGQKKKSEVEYKKAQKEKIGLEEAYNDKLNSEAQKFKANIANKSEEELSQISNEVTDEIHNLIAIGAKRHGREGLSSKTYIEKLTPDEKYQYDLLVKKQTAISQIKYDKKNLKLKKLLFKETDKKVSAPHKNTYLSQKEIQAINNYYDDYAINYYLRGQGGHAKDFDEIEKAFQKAPAITEDAVVYRGVNIQNVQGSKEFINSIKEGAILDNPGYTSTSTSCTDNQFKQFALNSMDENGVLMRIKLPKGTKGILGGHNEFLLSRNAKIKVNKLDIIDGTKVADCEYILPHC